MPHSLQGLNAPTFYKGSIPHILQGRNAPPFTRAQCPTFYKGSMSLIFQGPNDHILPGLSTPLLNIKVSILLSTYKYIQF